MSDILCLHNMYSRVGKIIAEFIIREHWRLEAAALLMRSSGHNQVKAIVPYFRLLGAFLNTLISLLTTAKLLFNKPILNLVIM